MRTLVEKLTSRARQALTEIPFTPERMIYMKFFILAFALLLLWRRARAQAPSPFKIEIDADDIPPGTKSVERYVISSINFQKNLPEILGH
jgi:hypothetical protein